MRLKTLNVCKRLLPAAVAVAVAALLLIASCVKQALAEEAYTYAEITVFHKLRDNDTWIGDTPTQISFGRRWHWDHVYTELELSHISNIDRGKPFNNLKESWMDLVGVTLGWRF